MKEIKVIFDKINNKWVRLIAWILVFVNTSGLILGYQLLPFDNEELVEIVSVVALFVVELWNHWKNNSYTDEAREADIYMSELKERRKLYK